MRKAEQKVEVTEAVGVEAAQSDDRGEQPPSGAERSEDPDLFFVAEAGADHLLSLGDWSERLLIEAPSRITVRPMAEAAPHPRLWVVTQPASAAAEQFRVLALKLKEQPSRRVLALVAPTPEVEGGLIAANLALALGESGRARVLLLDAHLRGSELAQLFPVGAAAGLGDQVRYHERCPEASWDAWMVSSTVSLLPAGRAEENPAALLSSDPMIDLIREGRRIFDYVVVAPPPVTQSADINILQEHLDGLVLAVRAGVTRRESLRRTVDQLGLQRLIGMVLVDAPA